MYHSHDLKTVLNVFYIEIKKGHVARLKEQIEKYQDDMKNSQTREYTALDKCKKYERQLRDFKEELTRLTQKETDAQARRANLQKQIESAELEISTLKVRYEPNILGSVNPVLKLLPKS